VVIRPGFVGTGNAKTHVVNTSRKPHWLAPAASLNSSLEAFVAPLLMGPLFSVVGTSRCDVRAACSGATLSKASVARTFVPPATTRAGTAQRAVPTIALTTYKERAGVRRNRMLPIPLLNL